MNKNIEDEQNEIELLENSPIKQKKTLRDVSPCESAFLGKIVKEQVKLIDNLIKIKLMLRIHASKPAMLKEFEERFQIILKRIYRSLQQHEIRERVSLQNQIFLIFRYWMSENV